MKTQSIAPLGAKAPINQNSKKAYNKSHKDFRKQRKNPQKKCWLEQS